MPIKLIATDLDGTFLTSQRIIHPKNLAAAKECIQQGIIFCLASGRGINTMTDFGNQLGIPGPYVSSNGAHVVGLNGEVLHSATLPQQARDIILQYGLQNNIHTNSYHQNTITFSKPGTFADMYQSRTGLPHIPTEDFQTMASRNPTKLLFIDHPENILKHQQEMQTQLAPFQISIVISEPDYVEFLPPNINKGAGLKLLAQNLNIKQSEVAAIGDWDNDLEMIQWAGTSAAVANASTKIQNAAQTIVASNDEAGVHQFLQGILASK